MYGVVHNGELNLEKKQQVVKGIFIKKHKNARKCKQVLTNKYACHLLKHLFMGFLKKCRQNYDFGAFFPFSYV